MNQTKIREEKLKNIRNIGIFVDNRRFKIDVTEKILDYVNMVEHIKEHGPDPLGLLRGGGCGVTDEDRESMIISPVQKTDWLNKEINFVDVDIKHLFDNQFELTMKLIDGAVSVFSAVDGVQTVAKRLWRERVKHGVCSIALMTHIDKEGADFWGLIKEIEDGLGANLLITQLPIYNGDKIEGVIDLTEMREYAFEFNPESVDSLVKKNI